MNHPPLLVLLVEDDRDLAATVSDYLSLESVSVDHAYDGLAGLNLANQQRYDVILLDLMLPRLDGLSVCQRLRSEGVDSPVLMLTALDTLDDKIAGFRAGTDDYLVKPFALEELLLRIYSLAKRRSGHMRKLQVADLTMELDSRRVNRAGENLKLTPSAWKILETLMRASPSVVTRSQLEKALWADEIPDSNSFKVHLYNLRQQVDKHFEIPLIHTLAGQGFLIKDES